MYGGISSYQILLEKKNDNFDGRSYGLNFCMYIVQIIVSSSMKQIHTLLDFLEKKMNF
jgi:hypothetical protein